MSGDWLVGNEDKERIAEVHKAIAPSTPSQDLVWAALRTFFGSPNVRDLDALDAQVAFLGIR